MGSNAPFGLGFGDYRYYQNIRQSEPARSYTVTSGVSDFPLTLSQVKEHLKIDAYNTDSDDYISQLIRSVTLTAETCTRMDIQRKTYQFYMARFAPYIELRKRPFGALTSVQTLNADSTWTTIDPSTYYVSQAGLYPRIYPLTDTDWPDLSVCRTDAIKIIFTAGFAPPTNTSCPMDLQLAMLNHAALLHEQRGDWGSADLGVAMLLQNLPSYCQLVYNGYRVTNHG